MGCTREVWSEQARKVRQQFERWRAGKQGHERIPSRLWGAAAALCATYGIHRVSRWLHLNHTALRKRAAGRLRPRPGRPKPAFVEWSLPIGLLPGTSSAEYVVEVAGRGDGAQRIHVRGASVTEVAALTRALRADASGS